MHNGSGTISSPPGELASMETNLPTAKTCLPPGIPGELPNTALPWMALDLNLRPLQSLRYGWEEIQDTVTKNKARGI